MSLTTSLDTSWHEPAPSTCGRSDFQKPKRNVLLRVVDAVAESNRRKAERAIARSIARHGARVTDDLKRQGALRLNGRR